MEEWDGGMKGQRNRGRKGEREGDGGIDGRMEKQRDGGRVGGLA